MEFGSWCFGLELDHSKLCERSYVLEEEFMGINDEDLSTGYLLDEIEEEKVILTDSGILDSRS